MFSRNAYVGIESPYGTVTAGRLTTPLFVSTILFNPFIDSYVFSPMVYHTYLGLGTFPTYSTDQGVTGDSGWSNAVSYSSPNFSGLSATAMYALGNTTENGAKKWSGQVLYFHGPFAATAVYQYVNFNNVPGDLGSFETSGVPGPEEPERRASRRVVRSEVREVLRPVHVHVQRPAGHELAREHGARRRRRCRSARAR